MKSVTITRLLLDARHIVGLGYERADGELCRALAQHGVAAKLFVGRSEASLNDLARQLARSRSDLYMFAVRPHSASAARALGAALRRLRPTVHLAFWMADAETSAKPTQQKSPDTLLSAESPQAVAAALVGANPTSDGQTSSLYRAGIFADTDLGRLGLHVAAESIEDDLDWLRGVPATQELLVDGVGAGGERIAQLVARLVALGWGDRLVLKVSLDDVSSTLAEALSDTPFRSVLLEEGTHASLRANSLAALQQMLEDRKSPSPLDRASLFAKNGLIASYTGAYHDGNLSPAVYHLELPLDLAQNARRNAYQWSGQHMSAKSAAIILGREEALALELPRFTSPEHEETAGWPKHVYAVSDEVMGKAWVDGEEATEFPIVRIPFRQLATGMLPLDAMTIVTLSDVEDVEELEARLKRFHETGEIEVGHALGRFHFENSCRWLSYGHCKLSVMRRLQVAADLTVTSCRDAGRLGRVGEPIEQMLVASRRHQQMEEVRRGCASCPVRDVCSRCANLPDTWVGRYCEIRIRYPATPLYFELWYFLRLLAEHGRTLSGITTLRVSAEGLPVQHLAKPGISAVDASRRPIIVSVDEQHFAWVRSTRKLSQLSAPLSTMLEGAWTGLAEPGLTEAVAERFAVRRDVAQGSVVTGLAKLAAVGLLEGAGHA